jgi:predicted TPR repeat methyltransferase
MSRKKKKRRKQKLSSSKKKSIQRRSPSSRFPFDVSGELRKACQYLQSGQLQRAERIFKKVLGVVPNHSECLYLLGMTAHQLGKTDTAVNLINKAIMNDPKNPTYHNDLGIVFQVHDKLDEAISCYQKALELRPDFAEAYNNMGIVFQDQDKLDEAISCYQKALELRPDDAEAYNNMGSVLQDQGKLSEAISCYQEAVQLKPDYAEAYNHMGSVFQLQGKLDEAISCYQKALELRPDDAEAYNNMGIVLQDQDKVDEAISCYQKALEIAPNHAEAYNNMGNALNYQGKLAEAAACFQQAVKLDPENFSAKHYLAAVTGQTTEVAPPGFIKNLFDQYSTRFERHVVETLSYKIPTLLRRTFHTIVKNELRFKNVIDLGCGTGLAGMEFRVIADRLTGIDISPKMIEEAKKKHVYDILLVGDIIEFLNDTAEKYDLFIATDVFIYIGNVERIFDSVQNRSLRGAYFLFSTESCARNDYVLRRTGRYAHSRIYIQSVAKEHGFVIEMCQSAGIRKERGQWIMGDIFVLKFGG